MRFGLTTISNTDYIHSVINHAEKYVDGQIHTNGVENFWSLAQASNQRHVCFG